MTAPTRSRPEAAPHCLYVIAEGMRTNCARNFLTPLKPASGWIVSSSGIICTPTLATFYSLAGTSGLQGFRIKNQLRKHFLSGFNVDPWSTTFDTVACLDPKLGYALSWIVGILKGILAGKVSIFRRAIVTSIALKWCGINDVWIFNSRCLIDTWWMNGRGRGRGSVYWWKCYQKNLEVPISEHTWLGAFDALGEVWTPQSSKPFALLMINL